MLVATLHTNSPSIFGWTIGTIRDTKQHDFEDCFTSNGVIAALLNTNWKLVSCVPDRQMYLWTLTKETT